MLSEVSQSQKDKCCLTSFCFYPHPRTCFFDFLERGKGINKEERNTDVRHKQPFIGTLTADQTQTQAWAGNRACEVLALWDNPQPTDSHTDQGLSDLIYT